MRSAMWIGGHDFEIQESQPLEPGPGEVRISVHACGVCGTDLHAIQGLARRHQAADAHRA